ncbi:MAG: hypothetical protein K8R69_10705, partial [Deltaproteobacteria bacterium]|nr:hypothetical protein [Deltaproteobacteria bacterium]
ATGSSLAASILDQLAFASESSAPGPIHAALQSGDASDLSRAVGRLSASQRRRLESAIPAASLEEFLEISRESDPQLFAESLYQWAQREESANRLASAGLIYQVLSQNHSSGAPIFPGLDTALRQRAGARLDAIQGRGALGARVEFLGRRLAQEASDPVMLAGMAAGSFVFSTARTAFLSRMLASPTRSVIGARALASTGAFLLEVPAFWGTTKGLHEAIHPGQQAWDMRTNLRELAGLGLTLGAMKLTGALSSGLSRRLAPVNPAEWSSGQRFVQGLMHQGGTLGGILFGHRLEEAAGLRAHVDGGTTLVDSVAMLLQFHVGGRLSQQVMGSRFQAYTQDLELRGRFLEQQALSEQNGRLRDGLNGIFGNGGTGGGLVPALATAGDARSRPNGDGLAEARAQILMMAMDPEGPNRGEGASSALVSPISTGTRRAVQEPESRLPERQGASLDSLGQVVDRFEPEIPPQRLLRLVPETVLDQILEQVRFNRADLGKINDQHFGRGLGLALQARMREVEEGLSALPLQERFENMPEPLRQAIRSADEMVGMVEYLQRSNQRRILNTLWESVDPEIFDSYDAFKRVLVDALGPHFSAPAGAIARGSEVIQPNEAVLSIGSGDMMGLLALYRHNIRPGGHSWRTRLFVNARQAQVADEINGKGTYEGNTNLRGIRLNYAHDPRILAVGPQGYQGMTRELLQRTVRLQLLNVPSDKLHEVLTADYIRSLPENAILLEVIGGFIGPEKRGPYQAARGERSTILPYQFINQALQTHGRGDVRVVSGGGYIPGKFLWRGEPVEMVFAGPEEDMHSAPEAELVTHAFAGRSRDTGFLRADFTHYQHSTELGKAIKNVTTLIAGDMAVGMALRMQDGAIDAGTARGRFEAEIREPLFALMQGVLVHNEVGINPIRAQYRQEVRNDFWRCSEISMEEVFNVVQLARGVDINNPEVMRRFLSDHVVNNARIATTRNPKRGIAQGIVELWRGMGSPYRTDELLPRKPDGSPAMTQEGVNSLPPLMEYYNFENHPIENRRLPQMLYDAFTRFNPNTPLRMPPEVPEYILRGLRSQYPQIREVYLRRALEGKSGHNFTLLNNELRRLDRYQSLNPEDHADLITRQVEVVQGLKSAMLAGSPGVLRRSPIIRPPYGNMFIIEMQEPDGRSESYRAYIRVDGQGVMNRLTQMGMFLRSFREGSRVNIDVVTTGLDPRKNAGERGEIEYTIQRILTAFRQTRPADEIELTVNQRRMSPDPYLRDPVSASYFKSLAPLVERLRGNSGTGPVSANKVRNLGADHAQVLDEFLQKSPGWPMILGYFGGPLNSAIKSALTRPERGTFVGVYDNGRMVDAFSVFRAYDNTPRVLSHHLLSRLVSEFKDKPDYQDLASPDYFDGLPLDHFFEDFESYSNRIGRGPLEYRLIPLRSLPIEEALAGQVDGINPALLRLFLEQVESNPERQQMIRELEPFYERPMAEVRERVREVIARYLDPFYQEHRDGLGAVPIFKFFETHGPDAISHLTTNGEEPHIP